VNICSDSICLSWLLLAIVSSPHDLPETYVHHAHDIVEPRTIQALYILINQTNESERLYIATYTLQCLHENRKSLGTNAPSSEHIRHEDPHSVEGTQTTTQLNFAVPKAVFVQQHSTIIEKDTRNAHQTDQKSESEEQCAHANSASYPQRDGKWVVAFELGGEGTTLCLKKPGTQYYAS